MAEADLTPLTPATIYHFPGTFSFSSREKGRDEVPANFISLHVSGTFRHNRVGWHRPEAFAFFLRLFSRHLLLLLFLFARETTEDREKRTERLFARESQLQTEINSLRKEKYFRRLTFEFRPFFFQKNFSTILFHLPPHPFLRKIIIHDIIILRIYNPIHLYNTRKEHLNSNKCK